MPMNYDDENSQMSGSIFSNPELNAPSPARIPAQNSPEKPDILSNLIRHLSSKLVESDQKKIQKIADKIYEENGDMVQILNEFGAKLVCKPDYVEVVVARLALFGTIRVDEETGELVLDDGAKEIFTKMANYVNGRNSFEFTMNMYAEVGFYPVGNLTNEKINYKGRELTVLKGVLMNEKGETRNIYMHNGRELLLEDDTQTESDSTPNN